MSSILTPTGPAGSGSATNPSITQVVLSQSNPEDEPGPIFTLFPKLTPELRNKIWKEAWFQIRIVDLWLTEAFTSNHITYRSHCRPPGILHTSREGRGIGLQHYALVFRKDKSRNARDAQTRTQPLIYVNWDCDIILPVPFLYNDPASDGSLADDDLELEMLSDLSRDETYRHPRE